jgi:hypothetical protein
MNWVGNNPVHSTHIRSPVKMEQTVCSETSAIKTQTRGNYPKETIQHSFNYGLMCIHYNITRGPPVDNSSTTTIPSALLSLMTFDRLKSFKF